MVGGVVAMLSSPAAAAHVDAELDGTGPGGFGVVTLGVPTESGKPSTTKVQVRIPDETPLRTVRAEPLAGWTLDIQTRKIDPPLRKDDGTPVNEVVSTVTWTAAAGGGIPQGQFQEFGLYLGPMPDADTLALPTTQTFSDGSTEVWAEAAGHRCCWRRRRTRSATAKPSPGNPPLACYPSSPGPPWGSR